MRGYKVCVARKTEEGVTSRVAYVLVELEIPEDATWFTPAHEYFDSRLQAPYGDNELQKSRTDKAVVVKIHGGFEEAWSIHDNEFVYKVGATVTPKLPFDPMNNYACSSGIHFFVSKENALKNAEPPVWFFPGSRNLHEVIVDEEEKKDA